MLFVPRAAAQVDEAAVDTSASHTHGMRGFSSFDPTFYQVQKRWRPTFENDSSKWWNRFTLGVSSGMDFVSDWHAVNSQVPVQAFLGYRVNPVHQVRLQVGLEKMQVEGQLSRRRSMLGEVQYLANISNFISGYNPNRVVDVSTLVGAGARYYGKGALNRLVPYARVGLDVSMRIGPNLAVFVQPYAGLSVRHSDLFVTKDPSKFNPIYGANAGVAANFNSGKEYYSKMAPLYRAFFYEASTGWGFNMNAFNASQSGSNEWLGVGRWLDPAIGVRVGVMGQQNYWDTESYGKSELYRVDKHHAMMAGRAELLLNLRNLSSKNSKSMEDPVWEFDLAGGVQYGYNAKDGVPNTNGTWRCYYYGFTGALQALYKVSPGSYIFIEPRFFNNIYQIPYANYAGKYKKEIDRFVTFNVGTRIYAAPDSVRRANDHVFSRGMWAGLGFGGMKMFEPARVEMEGFGTFQPAVSLSLGYDIHPYASVRLQGEWANLARVSGNWNTNYQLLDARLFYMLPFTNVLRGVDSRNRFHSFIELGPSLSAIVGQESRKGIESLPAGREPERRVGNMSLGAAAGILVSYDLNKKWDLYAEVQGQYNLKTGFTPGPHGNMNNAKWGLYAGTRYHFNKSEIDGHLDTDVPEWMKGWFLEGSTGWTAPLRGSTRDGRQGGTLLHRSGALFNMNFGRWLTPYLGARVGLQAQQHSIATDEKTIGGIQYTNYSTSATGSMTLELLTDPLNFFKGYRERGDRWFDLNLSAGFQAGYVAMGNHNAGSNRARVIGFVATAQPLFRVAENVWLYAEPRYSTFHYDSNHFISTESGHGVFRNVAVSAGARILRPTGDRDTISYARSSNIDDTFKRHWWIGLQAGGARDLDAYKSIGGGYGVAFQPALSFNAGYDLGPFATLRGQFEYSLLGNYNAGAASVDRVGLYNLRLIYMLNMTNLWQRTRRWPRFSAYPEIGVAYSHHSGASFTDNKGERHNNAFGFMLGAMAAYRVNNSFDVTVETQEQYHLPKGFMPHQSHLRMGNGYWNLTAGMRYHLQQGALSQIHSTYKPEWMKGWFLEGSYGLNVPMGKDISFAHAMGNSWRASLGHWFTSTIGFRLGIAGAQTYWSAVDIPPLCESATGLQLHGAYSMKNANQQLGGRVELMVNPLNFFKDHRHADEEGKFDLNLALGADFGAQFKANAGEKLHYWHHKYVGFTGAVQALYRVGPGMHVFVEPRFHTSSYDVPNTVLLTNKHAADRFFDLSVGARISRNTEAHKSLFAKDSEDENYRKQLWIGVDLGALKQLNCERTYTGGLGLQPGVGINVGYDLHPLATFRLQGKYDFLHSLDIDERYQVTSYNGTKYTYNGNFNQKLGLLNLRAIYMLNLTNLWHGTRDVHNAPRLSAYWEFGPTFSYITSCKSTLLDGEMAGGLNPTPYTQDVKGRGSLGLMTGIDVAIRVAPKWDVTIESMWQYNLKNPFLPYRHHARPYSVLMEFGVGSRYYF